MIKWRRIEAGWITTTIDSTRYDIVNMRGQAVRYTGPTTPCWELRAGSLANGEAGKADHATGATVGSYFTQAEAKRALDARLARQAV